MSVIPIKRSTQLAPLSREHHDTLLLAWKLRQGIKLDISPRRMAAYCKWYWSAHMQDHFTKEECGFEAILPHDHPMMKKMIMEHRAIKQQVDGLSDTSSPAAFEELAEMVTSHVRFEEREMFKLIELTATPEQLNTLALTLPAHTTGAEDWKDEFWGK